MWCFFFSFCLKAPDSKALVVPVGDVGLWSRLRNSHDHWRTVDCFRLEMRYNITGGSRLAKPQLVGGTCNDYPAGVSRQACVMIGSALNFLSVSGIETVRGTAEAMGFSFVPLVALQLGLSLRHDT